MRIETFPRIFGIVFLVVGIGGFIPGLTQPHNHPGLVVEAASGMGAARTYARVVAIAYAVLTIICLIPASNTVFGLAPIYGHDIWLHAVLAAVAAYFGFAYREPSIAAART